MTKRKKAFSLVEIIIAMFVFGILITLSILAVQIIQKNVRNSQRTDVVNTVNIWLTAFHGDNRYYPNESDMVLTTDSLSYSRGGIEEEIIELSGPKSGGVATTSNSTRYCYQREGVMGGSTFKFAAELEGGSVIEVGNSTTECTNWLDL